MLRYIKMATNRDYTKDFQHNVKVSLEAEEIARELLEQLTLDEFVSVRDDPAFYHVGDLLNQNWESFDVKDDGVIHRTGNVFCETRKRWKSSGTVTEGWMLNGEYDYLVVLDRVKHHIYILDFEKLKKVYRTSGHAVYGIDMGDNYTDGFVISLKKCRALGVLIDEAEYEYNDTGHYYDIVA